MVASVASGKAIIRHLYDSTSRYRSGKTVFLVESDGALLRVFGNSGGRAFQVLEVNVVNGHTKEVHNLGNRALFLSYNSSFSLQASPSPSPYTCKPNCIYNINGYVFTDVTMGVYELTSPYETRIQDLIFTPFSNLKLRRLPMWVQIPSHYPSLCR